MDNLPLFEMPPEEASSPQSMPLAARMRPRTFGEFVGQEHLVAEGRVFRTCIEADRLPSMVFWGPPGSGKTTLARIIASVTRAQFSSLSAVSAGVADLRHVIAEGRKRLKHSGQKTILFVDEIHRFNKAQQDAVLPFVEDGTVTFIGATTENPSFEVIAPLLSRSRVFRLNPLSHEQIRAIVERAIHDGERGLGKLGVSISEEALRHLVTACDGDARIALNALEMAASAVLPDGEGSRSVDLSTVEEALQHRALLYDKTGEQHYDLISALHKSLRGSDPDASLYWLGRMLESGEDPLYIARRLVRFASEDVGVADPQALVITVAAQQAVHFIGLPEGSLALAQAVVYLAAAPKSNSLYAAYSRVQQDIRNGPNEPVPLHLCNPVTDLMRGTGYGKGYKYAHDYPGHFVRQQNLPPSLEGRRYYLPGEQGYEREIADRLKKWWGEEKG
ncbi:MAG: replication-associated recombination protein A [Dehalococcoidia bacterium]|nr:replication-associated recombination protein A [Dehalococcoidia bacterium]